MSYRFDKLNYLVVQDKRRRSAVRSQEIRRKLLRGITRDVCLPRSLRIKARDQLARLPKNSNPVRTVNRCNATGRARAVDRRLKRARATARTRILGGGFPGIGKASW